jgi:seryl-tRNA synthetase
MQNKLQSLIRTGNSLKKTIEKMKAKGQSTTNAEALLNKIRQQYKQLAATEEKPVDKEINPA